MCLLESPPSQIHQHIKPSTTIDTQDMNVTDYTVEEHNKDSITSNSEYEITRQCDYFQSVDNESLLVAEKVLKSSISPEYTVEVCQWTNVIIPYFNVT